MEHDRLSQLLGRFEAGIASETELDELAELLATDYEARERFLDHAQIEGLLYGTGLEDDNADVVPLSSEPRDVPSTAASGRRRIAAGAIAAALAVSALGGILWTTNRGDDSSGVETVSPSLVGPPARLSAEEQYLRASRNTIGGASQAHPETASTGETVSHERPVEFNRDIRPILSDNCFFCHGPDAADRKADLRLDTPDGATRDLGGYAAIVQGNPDASELIDRVFHQDPDSVMPPPESKRSLGDDEKELLRRWIEEGAEWQKHWAFEPPVRRPLPEVSDPDWPRNPIDHFVLRRLDEKGMSPSPPADRATLLRRVTLDLTGLPPTLAETEAFLADESPEAYEKVVDELLARDSHAERMAWQWMESSRYADTDGYQNDGPREMWPWRDWVIRAYRANMPFDQFTVEQLAGDLLPDPTRSQLIATGFNRNNRYNSESGLVLEEFLLENAADRVDTTMTVWMGLTMACARCHDHKYDPLTQRDYYRLVSYFDNITESGRAVKFGNSEPWIHAPTPAQEKKLAALEDRLASARNALAAAVSDIVAAQSEWETSDPDLSAPIVPEGLSLHYGVESPVLANGDDAVDLEDKVDGLVGNNRFSIAFEMIPERVDRGVVFTTEAGGTTRKGVFVAFHEGRLRFSINSRWIAGVTMVETERVFESGEPVHIALTNDGAQRARDVSVWINGERAETRTIHNTNSNKMDIEGETSATVGAGRHHPSWKGALSDLRFYSRRTLRPGEIELLAEPTELASILAKPADERTPTEAKTLRHYFLTHGAEDEFRELHAAIGEAHAELTEFRDSLPTTMVMEEAPGPKETHLRVRGEYHNKGEVVSSGIPEVFPEPPEAAPGNRLGLARWLVDESNPLTARVVVNRYWQMLFGRGLVKTSEDFGTQGSLPSHPDLLDWLALEFRESGWDTRHVLRAIVTSATYRQSSAVDPDLLERDPENIHLARAPRLKLSGDMLRDQALASSGLLVDRIGGPSVKPYQPANLWKEASNHTYHRDDGDALYRRSLYTYWKRTLAPPAMAVLDTADREWCSVRPKRTNTPLQALTLLNETAFFEAARNLGERMTHLPEASPEEQIRFAFRSVLTRSPSEEELSILTDSYQGYLEAYRNTPDEASRLPSTGDSKPSEETDLVELAAATAVANVIYNLEEASVRE